MAEVRDTLVSSVIDGVITPLDLRVVLENAASGLGKLLKVSRVLIAVYAADESLVRPPVEWSARPTDPTYDRATLAFARHLKRLALNPQQQFIAQDVRSHPSLETVRNEIDVLQARAAISLIFEVEGKTLVNIILYDSEQPRAWKSDELSLLSRVLRYLKIGIDHCRAVERLSVSEIHYRNVFEKSVGAHYDLDGIVRFVNAKFRDMTGLSAADLRGYGFESLIDTVVADADKPLVLRAYAAAIAAKQSAASLEYRIVNRKTGQTSWIVDQFGPVSDPSGKLLGFESIALDVTDQHTREEQFRKTEARYRRLVEHSDAIIFHTDENHGISFISRRALDFFGVSPEDFVAEAHVRWYDFVHPDDQERVQIILKERRTREIGFDEEFRIINRVTGRVRWLLMRLVPAISRDGEIEGFDGFGMDISSRREAQDALDVQSKKIRALYTVASAIRGYLDPASIAARGITALCDATGADAGAVYLYASPRNEQLALVSHYGFSPQMQTKNGMLSSLSGLASYVARNGQALFISDLETDHRGASIIADEEGLRSIVLVPIATDEEILGTICLLSRERARFDGGTVMLVSAAANQIGLAARQANLLTLYQKQTKNLSALYRLSHELSRNLSVDEIFQNAFTIIRDELGLKRLWLGLLNEVGTRIIGQAAYGPGWRRRLVEMNVEISGRDHPIARAVANRSPIVIDNADEVLQEFGVRRIFSRLAIHSVVLVPLIAGGQVIGVLAAQPGAEDSALEEEEITLLSSLASEIAVTVLTKRLEDRIGEAEKMRTAGLLAAGIAHNFNNVLQAIMGQASLIEMQSGSGQKTDKAARIINEAAMKGAGLVKQLLSFAHLEEARKEISDVNALIDHQKEGFQRLVQPGHRLNFALDRELPHAYIDSMQVTRILQTLLQNAADAMPDGGEIEIFTDRFVVNQQHPHYDVPYGNYIRVGVKDHGMGMDDETRRRCFEPFFTTKNVDRGTGLSVSGAGLGLAAAYALARRNGGRLTVESQLGYGSVFTVYVPIYDGSNTSSLDELQYELDQPADDSELNEQVEMSVLTSAEPDAEPAPVKVRPTLVRTNRSQ